MPRLPLFFYILKRKRNATLSKMIVPSFSSKHLASDNKIAKYRYLSGIQHKNQTAVTYNWRAATKKCKATPIFKVTKFKNCAYFAKKRFKPISFF